MINLQECMGLGPDQTPDPLDQQSDLLPIEIQGPTYTVHVIFSSPEPKAHG